MAILAFAATAPPTDLPAMASMSPHGPGSGPPGSAGDALAALSRGSAPGTLPATLSTDLDIVAVGDLDTRLTYLNSAGRHALGLGPDDVLAGRRWIDLLSDSAARLVRETAIPTARRVGVWSGRTALRAVDAQERPAAQLVIVPPPDRSRDECTITVLQNLSEDRLLDGDIGSTELLKEVAAAVGEAIFVMDLDGRYRFVNPAGQLMLGLLLSEVLGRTPAELKGPEEARTHAEIESRLINEGETIVVETERDVQGGTRSIMTTAARLRDRAGGVIGTVMIKRDVTAVRQLEAHFRQTQKLEAIGRLAAGVAHDFGNVLVAIQGFGELLRDSLVPGDPGIADVNEILRAAQRGRALTQQLLTFARQQPQQVAPVAVDDLIDELLPLLRQVGGRSVPIDRAGGTHAVVHADRTLLEQVIVNLVVNARDATVARHPTGATVTIETGVCMLGKPMQLSTGTVPPGRYATIDVRDVGAGIDETVFGKLFEPFFTTKPPGEGTGIGLATAFGIVTQAGGGMDVTSALGAGSTFRVYLPVAVSNGEPFR
jgi:two-component system cell cycle sensor histidine kinase/response regulator CckA